MEKGIRARVLAIGRPLRVEIQLDGQWLERLRRLLQELGEDGGSYPIHRYLEELLEADIVYREGHPRRRGPFLPREDIIRWLRQRHAGNGSRATAGKR
jgi:hypothetical protein